MQVNKKPSTLADTMFDVSNSISTMSTLGQLHGRYLMLKEMQIFLGEEEIKLNKLIQKAESNV